MTSPRLNLRIDGRVYPTLDWSFGGFRIGGYKGRHRPGDRFMARLCAANGQATEAYLFARVVRTDRRTGELSATFDAFGEGTWEALERAAMSALRGRRARAG